MGNLMKETMRLYTIDWTPSNNADEFVNIDHGDNIPNPINGKILIPVSKLFSKRELVLKYHHKVILIEDLPCYQQLIRLQFRGVPLISEQDLNNNPQKCRQLHYNDQYCPIPLILERFHQSYVKNYVNSFHFYGINILPYNKIEEYLKSCCNNRYMICSNYELEQLSFKIKSRPSQKTRNKLTILCFCNKDDYRMSKRIQIFLQKQGIQLLFFQNMLDIIEKINSQYLAMPKQLDVKIEKLFFYLSEKQKDVQYLSKMVKKLQKSIRDIAVQKINSKQQQVSKIHQMHYSIVMVSNDSKQMRSNFQLYEAIEKEGLEDRIIFIRRENQITEKLTQKIYSVVQKVKFKKSSIYQKQLVFYGSLQLFKQVLKHFPSLKFKKFVDVNKQTDQIKDFLEISTQVVVTHLKVCTCQQGYSNKSIKCKMIYIRGKDATLKGYDKRQSRSCVKQKWFTSQEDLLKFYNIQNELVSVNFNYFNKRNSYISKILDQFFVKMQEKKTILYNRINNSIFLFSSEYYSLDQMSSYIMKYFNHKILGNYEQQCLFEQIKSLLYEELIFLCKNNRIEETVIEALEDDTSTDVFELSENIMQIMAYSPQFLQQVNSIWALFLYQDRKQHNTKCQVLLFLLILSFSKTNFVKYKNETIQSTTLMIKRNSTVYDMDNLTTFRNKNRNNFVYNLEFLACQIYQQGSTTDPTDILIKIQGNQLTSFHLYMPLWKKTKTAIICPFSKFQINTKAQRNHLLKLSTNSQHKLLQKFTEAFLGENPAQLRLFEQDRQMRKFDIFLDSMAHSKFETAGYIMKKITKEERMQNEECLNAFNVLYHLKRNQMQSARQKLREDKYNQILSRVIKALKGGEDASPDQKYLIPESFASNKRIEQSSKEYQNLDSNSNETQSYNCSAMMQTDPQMLRQIASDYKFNHKFSSNRSPSFKIKDKNRIKNIKIPIYNRKGHQQLSICDKLSQSSRKSHQKQSLSIVILPPLKPIKNLSESEPRQNINNTFGANFYADYSSIGSQKGKVKEIYGQMLKLKSTKSDHGKSQSQFLRQTPTLQKPNSPKLSQFARQMEMPWMGEEIEDSNNELLQQNQNEQTGNFNFYSIENQRGHQKSSEIISQIEQQIIQVDQESENSSEKEQNVNTNKKIIKNSNNILFPIKKKQLFCFPRKSLTEVKNIKYFKSPLKNIEEQKGSQLSISSSNPILNPNDKENTQNQRNKQNKLFTFFKMNQSLKPRFSIRNSLILSNISQLQKIDEKKQSLFYNFEDQKQKHQRQDISDMASISSLQIQQAEQIFPQQLIINQ